MCVCARWRGRNKGGMCNLDMRKMWDLFFYVCACACVSLYGKAFFFSFFFLSGDTITPFFFTFCTCWCDFDDYVFFSGSQRREEERRGEMNMGVSAGRTNYFILLSG